MGLSLGQDDYVLVGENVIASSVIVIHRLKRRNYQLLAKNGLELKISGDIQAIVYIKRSL